ncbi:hypothetical protein NW759_008958 [Fusarium solani]|nr:hypothetical protein NW759_008958 [Fusarium solani]
MNGTEARLFISWKQQDLFNVQKVRSFALQEPDHFIEFRKYVRNIIDWGRDERLRSIQAALDTLIEEGRKATLKARPPPARPGSSLGLTKRQKPF